MTFYTTVMKSGFYGNAKESLEESTPTKTHQSETSSLAKETSSASSGLNYGLWWQLSDRLKAPQTWMS